MKRIWGEFATVARLAREPFRRLSRTTTEKPRSISNSTRCEPMNPAPPVTKTVWPVSFIGSRKFQYGWRRTTCVQEWGGASSPCFLSSSAFCGDEPSPPLFAQFLERTIASHDVGSFAGHAVRFRFDALLDAIQEMVHLALERLGRVHVGHVKVADAVFGQELPRIR